jgi:hypothetical protein
LWDTTAAGDFPIKLHPAAALVNAGEKFSVRDVPYSTPIVTLCMAKTFGNPWGGLNRPLPNACNPRPPKCEQSDTVLRRKTSLALRFSLIAAGVEGCVEDWRSNGADLPQQHVGKI